MTKPFKHSTCMPEHAEVRMTSTGLQGGDAGHGGWTKLVFKFEAGSAAVRVTDRDHRCLVDTDDDGTLAGTVEIIVRGDWEMTGLGLALRRLGLHLLRAEMDAEMERLT